VRVAILADDLIWSTRLADLVRGAGGDVRPLRTAAALVAALPEVDRVIVDLTARAYDGIAAIEVAREAGLPVLAVGQHDDADLRRRALAAGAERVHPYRRLFEDGARVIAAWLAETPATAETPAPAETPAQSETPA
jgi:DNA-binding response OmpR family regulator